MKEVLRDTLRDVKHFEATSADTVDINGVTRSCRNHINYLHRHLSQGLWDARRQYVHRRRVPTSHPGHPPQRLLRTIPNPARRRGHLKSTASGKYFHLQSIEARALPLSVRSRQTPSRPNSPRVDVCVPRIMAPRPRTAGLDTVRDPPHSEAR